MNTGQDPKPTMIEGALDLECTGDGMELGLQLATKMVAPVGNTVYQAGGITEALRFYTAAVLGILHEVTHQLGPEAAQAIAERAVANTRTEFIAGGNAPATH